jgi:hypothetical protein
MIDYFDKEGIQFDAFYLRSKAIKRTDEYCNYNQIYLDFDICHSETESPNPNENNEIIASLS